jgi:hypothetical protein
MRMVPTASSDGLSDLVMEQRGGGSEVRTDALEGDNDTCR